MLYPDAIRFLYDLGLFGAQFGLEKTLKLAALAGNPHERLRFIHVAGTNGKGSTCAMLESIYRSGGLRVGLYTSPHLVAFGERIQVNRRLISETDIVRSVEEMQVLLNELPSSQHPTFFEVVTVMALRYFTEQNVDLVIWETGLGGRLDATNIVTPLASVITNIQFDHERWLGRTLPEIASEKAGIIKPRVPVITAEENPEPLAVISEVARRQQSFLVKVSRADVQRPPLLNLELPLLGEHQRLNAALARSTARLLSSQIPVNDDAIRTGLASVQWPGRLQVVQRNSHRTLVLDGAHNPAGAEALRAALERYFPRAALTLIFGVMGDKDWRTMCQILAPLARRIYLAPVSSVRTADPQQLRETCREINTAAEVAAFASVAEALAQSDADPWVLVTGSLYFVGEAMEALRLSAAPVQNERGLNEWTAAR